MIRLFMRKVREHPKLTELMKIVPGYREEIGECIKRFKNLDFGNLSDEELYENTEAIAQESGLLQSCYVTSWGILAIMTNFDTQITTLCFMQIMPKGSHFGF